VGDYHILHLYEVYTRPNQGSIEIKYHSGYRSPPQMSASPFEVGSGKA